MLTINLLPQRIRQERIVRARNMALVIILGLIFFVLGWLYFQKLSELNAFEKKIADKEKELTSPELKKKVDLVHSIDQRNTEIESRMTLLGYIRQDQNVWLKFLDDLSLRLPKEVWLSGMVKSMSPDSSKKGRMIDLEGFALGEDSIFHFIKNLRLSPNVNEIKLATVNVTLDRTGFVYKFKVSVETKLLLFPEF